MPLTTHYPTTSLLLAAWPFLGVALLGNMAGFLQLSRLLGVHRRVMGPLRRDVGFREDRFDRADGPAVGVLAVVARLANGVSHTQAFLSSKTQAGDGSQDTPVAARLISA